MVENIVYGDMSEVFDMEKIGKVGWMVNVDDFIKNFLYGYYMYLGDCVIIFSGG